MTRLFAHSDEPRVFAVPPGCDFAQEFVAGLIGRLGNHSPEVLAKTEVFLNTRRSMASVKEELVGRGPVFLPQLRLIPLLANDRRFPDIPGPVSPLRRRLELAQAVAKLLEGDRRFGAKTAVYELAESLAALMDEMHSEGVEPETLRKLEEKLDLSRFSQHWQRSLAFVNIIEDHWGTNADPDVQARQRLVIERICAEWNEGPPDHPVIVAGSTGSRGATQLLMQTAARLPQGAIVVPSFDFALPDQVWREMDSEEHPQYRFKALLDNLSIACGNVRRWCEDSKCNEDRNRLVSLALRPAPVTSQWMEEGPKLANIAGATSGLSLLEAPSQRIEAVAIALRLRKALAEEKTAALVTPDRKLARQVKAALGRWGIVPLDGTGQPLFQTTHGRLLRLVAGLMGQVPSKAEIVALLKHPLAHSQKERMAHLRFTHWLEGKFRWHWDKGPGTIIGESSEDNETRDWLAWLDSWLEDLAAVAGGELFRLVEQHESLAERLVSGSRSSGDSGLWDTGEASARAARETMDNFLGAADAGGAFSPSDYASLFLGLASRTLVYEPYKTNPEIRIWDTLDARMQRPDVVVAGGLNENVWPPARVQDPWLNSQMRREAGLLMPERAAGLSAHDFQQVISAPEVMLSRSIRTVDAPTLPSRWVSRLASLLDGITGDGEQALQDIKARGQYWIDLAKKIETPEWTRPASRPAPKPPVAIRPSRLSVTEIRTLITDPYAIYARHVLKLRPLEPLDEAPSALHRGTLMHKIFEEFIRATVSRPADISVGTLLQTAEKILSSVHVPRHVARSWLAEIEGTAEEFIKNEKLRRTQRWSPKFFEERGSIAFPNLCFGDRSFELVGKADRIDVNESGSLALYDYKTGTLPGHSQVRTLEKQLPLLTTMIESGAFENISGVSVKRAAYLQIGRRTKEAEVQRYAKDTSDLFADDWERFQDLIKNYSDPDQGFTSRRSMSRMQYGGDYDHLARYGEWDETSPACIEEAG